MTGWQVLRNCQPPFDHADFRFGSKPEKLNESKCFPLLTQQRTSPRYFGMSVSCLPEAGISAS